MILDAISNYLQNQPHRVANSETVSEVAANDKVDAVADDKPKDISLSQKREYLEFLSGHFDVTDMDNKEMNQLQTLLNDYGFISSNELNSMRSLSLAKQYVETDDKINAVDMLNQVKSQYRELKIPFSTAQQIDKVRVVIENMASARTQLAS